MHQIIHLSPVGCFTKARGKTVQKNREVSGVKRVCRTTPDLLQHTSQCHKSTMSNIILKHTPRKKLVTADCTVQSLRCVSAAARHTAKQSTNTSSTKPRKHLLWSNLLWNCRQDFLKIPSLWEAALETEHRCFSKVILETNVTPNIIRSSDSFSTVPPIVNLGDWRCNDIETIIVLVLLAVNFIPQRYHHSLTLPRSLQL